MLKEKEIPLVFFDRIAEHMDVPKVITDDFDNGAHATEHLIENGCRRIAFLSISKTLSIRKRRMNGYLDALTRNKINKDNSLILYCNIDDPRDNDLIRKLLKKKKQGRWNICFRGEPCAFDVWNL